MFANKIIKCQRLNYNDLTGLLRPKDQTDFLIYSKSTSRMIIRVITTINSKIRKYDNNKYFGNIDTTFFNYVRFQELNSILVALGRVKFTLETSPYVRKGI
jgi:hypothetical protein